jgi:hypothetical protein
VLVSWLTWIADRFVSAMKPAPDPAVPLPLQTGAAVPDVENVGAI